MKNLGNSECLVSTETTKAALFRSRAAELVLPKLEEKPTAPAAATDNHSGGAVKSAKLLVSSKKFKQNAGSHHA